uniref:(northern house mosquito) hypothetical protein n=1 Tax=Culex pipiens TaxID=7175 RepID=A0A8D8P7Q1_CULPI
MLKEKISASSIWSRSSSKLFCLLLRCCCVHPFPLSNTSASAAACPGSSERAPPAHPARRHHPLANVVHFRSFHRRLYHNRFNGTVQVLFSGTVIRLLCDQIPGGQQCGWHSLESRPVISVSSRLMGIVQRGHGILS